MLEHIYTNKKVKRRELNEVIKLFHFFSLCVCHIQFLFWGRTYLRHYVYNPITYGAFDLMFV